MAFKIPCGWRIVISPIIPYNSPPCYHSSMRHFLVLFIHLIAILTQLLQPGGVRSLIAECLLLKHQLLIVNRSWQRSPNLSSWDRILAGWMALLVRPTRLLRSAIALKLWLTNCYFAHNSLRFPALLPFFNASSRRPFHPPTRGHGNRGALSKTADCPIVDRPMLHVGAILSTGCNRFGGI